jgi:FtsZ-binding cell division protein ZapB
MITPDQLAQWKAAADKATPGPWEHDVYIFESEDPFEACVTNDTLTMIITIPCDVPMHRPIGTEWKNADFAMRDAQWEKAKHSQAMHDAAFIALAREAVPALIAEIEGYRSDLITRDMSAEIDELKAERDALKAENEHLRRDLDSYRNSDFERQLDEARSEAEKLRTDGPLWMRCAIAMLHDMVDQTDPSDIIGAALTRVGFQRRPDMSCCAAGSLSSGAHDETCDVTVMAKLRADAARMKRVYDLAVRWCNRPLSVTSAWLANDAEMFKKLRAAVESAIASEKEYVNV